MFTNYNCIHRILKKLNCRYFLLSAITLLLISARVQSQDFVKAYNLTPWWGGTGAFTDVGHSIKPALNGSDMTIGGYSHGLLWSAFSDDWMFLKLDASGNILCSSILGFGALRDDRCNSHIESSIMNGYILSGYYTPYYFHQPTPNFTRKASWSLIDDNCNHIMSRVISDEHSHEYKAVTSVFPNNFVNVGYIERYDQLSGVTSTQVLASRYSAAGTRVWANTYILRTLPLPQPFAPATDTAYSVCNQLTDNSYAITGTITVPGGGPIQAFVLKLNSAGVPLWSNLYSAGPNVGIVPTEARKIIPMPDGGFVIGGWFSNVSPYPIINGRYIYLLRIDANGNIIANKTYSINNGFKGECHSMLYLPDEDKIVFTGSRYFPAGGNDDILLCKVEASVPLFGNVVWAKTYASGAGQDKSYDLIKTGNKFSVTGEIFNTINGSTDVLFLKTDNSSNESSCMTKLEITEGGVFSSVPLTIDAEEQFDESIDPVTANPKYDLTLLCEKDLGKTGTTNGVLIPEKFSLFQNYPNPFNPVTVIKYALPYQGNVTIKVFDITGKEISILVNEYKPEGYHYITFNASELPSGVYFYKIEASSFNETRKMLLVK